MKDIFSLLERFSRVLKRDTATKEAIIKIIQEKTRVVLEPEQLSLKEGVLVINSSPTAKNEISLKEEAIKAELKEHYRIVVLRVIYK